MPSDAALPKAPAVPPRLGLHAALLALAALTTARAGTVLSGGLAGGFFHLSAEGCAFAAALLAILLSHEMGHYVFARVHRVDTSLPYVIPVPPVLPGVGLVSFGTLGAVIRMRSPIATRDALVDIGAAGPIAGAIVALPLLVYGLTLSHYAPSPTAAASAWLGHDSLYGWGRELWRHAHGLPSAAGHSLALGDDLFMRLCERLVLGPTPPGQDAVVHPVAMAGWFGLLVTSLNLFPIGQLDGGHASYALLGERWHRRLGKAVSVGLLGLALFSSLSWGVWWLVTTRFVGFDHPAVEDDRSRLDGLRLAICAIALLLFVTTFIPVPMDTV
ncbi:MAG: site-2 protease family protein [Deltaproteobacteria bacterium]